MGAGDSLRYAGADSQINVEYFAMYFVCQAFPFGNAGVSLPLP